MTGSVESVPVHAGDAAKHLMWRLRNGEGLAGDGPQLAVVMVGGTDLTYASFKVSAPDGIFTIR